MKDNIEFLVAVILVTLGIFIFAVLFIFSIIFVVSLCPNQGKQNAIIEKVYVEGAINKTNEIKIFPVKMGESSDGYTIEDYSVLEAAKTFFAEGVAKLAKPCGIKKLRP